MAHATKALEWYRQAHKEAIQHVYRQQYQGKHDQDKIDAVDWMERFGATEINEKER